MNDIIKGIITTVVSEIILAIFFVVLIIIVIQIRNTMPEYALEPSTLLLMWVISGIATPFVIGGIIFKGILNH